MDDPTPVDELAEMIAERRRECSQRERREHFVLAGAWVWGVGMLFVFLGWWADAVTLARSTGSAWDTLGAVTFTAATVWLALWTYRAWKVRR